MGGGKMHGVVTDSFKVSEVQRFTGTVNNYYKMSGYGFITMDKKGVVPEDKLFIYWSDITSADRFPSLSKDMKVKFSIKKEEKRGKQVVTATNVTTETGQPISLQDENDVKKTFVGGQFIRSTGTLKLFNPKYGYGYVLIDEGYQYDQEGVPKEIRVETAEVNAGGQHPGYLKDTKVEFGIWKTQKGAFKAYNMTGPGGSPLPAHVPEPKK